MAQKNKPSKTSGKDESQGETLAYFTGFIKAFTGPWTWDNLKSWIKLIALVLTVWWLFVQPFRIPSGSMEPTLHGDPGFFVGDRVFVNKLIYGPRVPFTNIRLFRLGEPKRWDIVVFRSVEPESPNKILIKRVVGLPGERVHIAGGKVYINGQPLELPKSMPDVKYTMGPLFSQQDLNQILRDTPPDRVAERIASIENQIINAYKYGILPTDKYSLIPPDHYLMLGDNSERSQDGRFFGWVPHENILGRASCIWWPIGRRRDFTGFSHTWWGMALIAGIPLLLIAYEISRSFFFLPWRVKRSPLKTLLHNGERVWINRAAFGWRLPFGSSRVGKKLPQRGAVVAFTLPEGAQDDQIEVLFGRVMALPGDTIKVEDGAVLVESVPVGDAGPLNAGAEWLTKKKATVPEDSYLVLADVDAEVQDGRVFGMLPEDCLVGSVAAVWWPPQRVRQVRNHGNVT